MRVSVARAARIPATSSSSSTSQNTGTGSKSTSSGSKVSSKKIKPVVPLKTTKKKQQLQNPHQKQSQQNVSNSSESDVSAPVKRKTTTSNKKSNLTSTTAATNKKVGIKRKISTTKVPRIVKQKAATLKVKPVKKLKAKLESQNLSQLPTSTVKVAGKPKKTVIKASTIEPQNSPKRNKSPARTGSKPAASIAPSSSLTPKKRTKKNATPPLTRNKKQLQEKKGSAKALKKTSSVLKRVKMAPAKYIMAKDQQSGEGEVVASGKKVPIKKRKIAEQQQQESSQDSNVTDALLAAAIAPVVASLVERIKPAKTTKAKEKSTAKKDDTIPSATKKAPKKVAVTKKPKISQEGQDSSEKGAVEKCITAEVNGVTTVSDKAEKSKKEKKIKAEVAKPVVVKKKKVEIKKIEEEEEEDDDDDDEAKKKSREKKPKLPRKVLSPPKKRALVPLKKRLSARVALDMDEKPVLMTVAKLDQLEPDLKSVKPEEDSTSSSDEITLDVVLQKYLIQQEQKMRAAPSKKPLKAHALKSMKERKKQVIKKLKKELLEKSDSSSSSPSSPEPTPKKEGKKINHALKTAAKKNNSKALVPVKARNLQVDKLRKKLSAKAKKKGMKSNFSSSTSGSESDRGSRQSSSSEDERAHRMKVFGFWSGPKKHRVASLNALAKVHCLYENEARPATMFSGLASTAAAAVTTTTTTSTDICTRTLRSGPGLRGAGRHWYDSASSDSSDSSMLLPYRRSKTPVSRKKKAKKKIASVSNKEESTSTAATVSSSTTSTTTRKVVRKKRCDMVMDLKDMVVRKRMASLNASAILAASYSFEKRTPNKISTSSVQLRVVKVQQQTSTTSVQKHVAVEEESDDIDSTPTSPNTPSQTESPEQTSQSSPSRKKPAAVSSKRNSGAKKRSSCDVKAPPKKRKRRSTEDSDALDDDPLENVIKLRAPKKVALIMNDTDVTITGVYVNTRSTEGYCISGMEYRISSTESTTVLRGQPSQQPPPPPPPEHVARHHHLHHHHHHHAPAAAANEQAGYHSTGEPPLSCDSICKQSYTPLGALSSMQPPVMTGPGAPGGPGVGPPPCGPPPQQLPPPPPPSLRVHHGGPSPLGRHGSSAFSAPPSYGSPQAPPPPDAAPYLHGYYQPAGPLIHAGSELCRSTSKLGGAPIPPPSLQPSSSLLLPPDAHPEVHLTSQQPSSQPPSQAAPEATSSSSPDVSAPLPAPPPPTHIVASQGSPFRHYSPYANFAPPYHHPQYFHTVPHPHQQTALAVATHHLPTQELCYTPCFPPPPPYKFHPAAYRRIPTQHYYSPTSQPDVYSALPGPSSASSSFQPPQQTSHQSNTSAPPAHQQQQQQQQQEATPSSSAPPPPPPQLSQPPEPPPGYHQFYTGYSPGPTGCYTHAAPPRGVAYLDHASYQSCPCPMQSCPKNVHTGPLTGDSKGPGPQETLFVMPPVAAAAAAAHPTSASRGPLPPGHPPSPARGSSGGPPVAQGPSPPATATDQHPPEASAWDSSEPIPPSTDSTPRGDAVFYATVTRDSPENSTDFNQIFRGSSKKRRLSISTRIDAKKVKTMPQEMPFPNTMDGTTILSSLSEPLLITTTQFESNQKMEGPNIYGEELSLKNGLVPPASALPPTPPASTDTSPPVKYQPEKRTKTKVVRSRSSKTKKSSSSTPIKKKCQPRKRNTSMMRSHGMQDMPPQVAETSPALIVDASRLLGQPNLPSAQKLIKPTVASSMPLPEIISTAKPATSSVPKPSTINVPKPNTSEVPKPTTSEVPKIVVNNVPKPSSNCAPKPSTSCVPKPSTSSVPKPSISNVSKPIITNNVPSEPNTLSEPTPSTSSYHEAVPSTSQWCEPVAGTSKPSTLRSSPSKPVLKPSCPTKTKPTPAESSSKPRKSKSIPSATDLASLPGNKTKPEESEEIVSPAVVTVVPTKGKGKATAKRKNVPSTSGMSQKARRQAAAKEAAAAAESAQCNLLQIASMRKNVTPRWSNGWSWEGEPFQAKVYLRSDDPPVLRNCYPAMRHTEGDIVASRDCVLLKSGTRKGDLPYVAKVASLWENPEDGEMMLSLLWYYRPEHTEQGRKFEDMSDEIFASKHKDNSSVACIEDKCYVLTFNEYCRYRATVKQIEEGAAPRPLVVPQLPPELSTGREGRIPNGRAAAELVFFCRKVYDFRQKRMLKNPG